MRAIFFSLLIFGCVPGHAQHEVPKQVKAARRLLPVKIDGQLQEEAWKDAAHITDMVEMRPSFGRREMPANKSDFYILYDNDAIYFGGICRETTRDSISSQLLGRDEIGVNDFAGIIFDTYQDKINGLGFYVTPLNEQFDVKYSTGDEDISWNAVYDTKTYIFDKGWSFEMRIPYSAIRFSKTPVQDWNIQVLRRRSKTGQQYSWNPVDPTRFGFINQSGTLTGIQDIEPPIRLSFSPYFSTYLNRDGYAANNWKASVNGGMDVKYGINDAFTMDMTLIPDFGQVQSDNQVLNLSPFEVKFNENRPFFNEGTELFTKADLFYSRRIGGVPLHYDDVSYDAAAGEKVIINPVQTKLLNATKISGRTGKKLGIGFFNAITRAEYATVEKANKETYRVQTSPLTNYNIMVLDQGLKHNSRVTLINTNVLRSGSDYDANVTAIDWDLYDKNINWNVWGQVNHSRLIGYEAPGKTYSGNMYNLFFGKLKGRFSFNVYRLYADEQYNQSDMGYFTNNNYVSHGGYMGYKWVKPKKFYNNIYLNLNFNYTQQYNPRRYQDAQVNGNVNGQLKNLWQVGIAGDIRPAANDFYDARMDGYVVKAPASWMKGFWINTNKAKKYAAEIELYHRSAPRYKGSFIQSRIANSYRLSDKLSLSLAHFFEINNNGYGFAYIPATRDSVVIGLRNRRTLENTLNIKYSFTNRMGLTLRVRHYWSKVHFTRLFNLEQNGNTEEIFSASRNPDYNINFFNVDMIYTWQFAAGSFINIGWKNAEYLSDQSVEQRYYHNLRSTLRTPQQNNLSIKVIYFLDYLNLKKKDKKAI